MTERWRSLRSTWCRGRTAFEAWQARCWSRSRRVNTVDRLNILLGETVLVLGQGRSGSRDRLCALSGAAS